MSLSLPFAMKAKPSSEKQIGDLADADLSAIFERLPPYDRLIISEVCRRWYELSRKPWFDITELDLSSIPGKHVGAIVRQCPNLLSIVARYKSFDLNELCSLSQASKLAAVKFYGCTVDVKGALNASFGAPNDIFAKIFSQNLQHASSVRELILHRACFEDNAVSPSSCSTTEWAFAASCLPASLTQLQLSYLCVKRSLVGHAEQVLEGLGRLQSLECLMLHEEGWARAWRISGHCDKDRPIDLAFPDDIETRICALKNLRELSLGINFSDFGRLVTNFPKLQVLHLNDVYIEGSANADLVELITKNSVLRILILSGFFALPEGTSVLELPARKRFPHGFGSDPLPLLHIFIGKEASERIRFATSPSEAVIIHPINEPMPQFLEREDIAPIFEGIWLAEKIKETAKFGCGLWPYERDDRATVVQRT